MQIDLFGISAALGGQLRTFSAWGTRKGAGIIFNNEGFAPGQ